MVHDLIGVGFGPFNIVLAIALQERAQIQDTLEVLFLDRQGDYRWHGNTLVSRGGLQISFLRDLVSLRNPTGPYSFINYLHKHDHLVDFINLGIFYPCRMEFDDYLCWVTSHLQEQSRYGEGVLRIKPMLSAGQVEVLQVISRNADDEELMRTTHVLVVSPGGIPCIPQVFRALRGDGRVFHHSQYLEYMAKQPHSSGKSMKIAIIGGGQSAAKAFINLNDSYPSVWTDIILCALALKPADDNPFVNEVFAPKFTGLIYSREHTEHKHLLHEYHNTNYSVMDADLIECIYDVFYHQEVSGIPRCTFRYMTTVERATTTAQGIKLALRNAGSGELNAETYNAVIPATGYERQLHRQPLELLAEYLDDHEIGHDYRLQTDEHRKVAIYVQGFSQASHGPSDTLLSVLPVHAEEISGSLYQHLKPGALARALHEHALAS